MSRARDIADQAYISDNKIQTNIALLAFKTAVNGSLAKYNLQDQVIDEYTDATGVDGTPSTNHVLTSGAYNGEGTATVTGPGSAVGVTVGSHKVHTFLIGNTGTDFTTSAAINVDWLVVAGGGAGGVGHGGGGGAGGFRTGASHAVTAQAYTITVGAGGTGGVYTGTNPTSGGISSIVPVSGTSIISAGGGHGGSQNAPTIAAQAGGSGGGGKTSNSGGAGNTPAISPITGEVTTVQGFAGGTAGTADHGGGGGGASEVGSATVGVVGGTGGDGTANSYRLGTGVSAVTYAGGGGGASSSGTTRGAGGAGGGGTGATYPTDTGYPTGGTADTGGGGGGGRDSAGGAGGSGIVVIRYLTSALTTYNNFTLQSTDTEAEAQPTKADMVMLIQDAGTGVGTVNTHIKGFISRDSGTTFTEGVLVDEGDWGDDKRILAFHDLDISAQPSDQTMCYKITTHSASEVYNTKIHATSIGWR